MDEFDGILILLLLQDRAVAIHDLAAWISTDALLKEGVSFEPAQRHIQQVPRVLEQHRFDSRAAMRSILATIEPPRLLELCRQLANCSATQFRLDQRTPHARGGLGQVWKAQDPSCARFVALKEMSEEARRHPSLVRRFLVEAQTTARLEHPNIVPVYWIPPTTPDSAPAYVMRFLDGETLHAAVERLHMNRLDDVVEFAAGRRELIARFLRACEALAYAHSQNVIHRDLKPANIILSDFGSVFLIDWGLAKQLSSVDSMTSNLENESQGSDLTQAGDRLGTPLWMAPEQAFGDPSAIDKRTDVFGLGATLFTILTGSSPRTPKSQGDQQEFLAEIIRRPIPRSRTLVPETPRAIDAICAKATALAPSDRYQDVAEFIDDMKRYLADEPVSVLPEKWMRRLVRRAVARPAQSVWIGSVIVIVLACGVLAASALFANRLQASLIARSAMSARAIHTDRLIASKMKALELDIAIVSNLPGAADLLTAGAQSATAPAAQEVMRQLVEYTESYLALALVRRDAPAVAVVKTLRGDGVSISENQRSEMGNLAADAIQQANPTAPVLVHPVRSANVADAPVIETFVLAPIRGQGATVGYAWLHVDMRKYLEDVVDLHHFVAVAILDDDGHTIAFQQPTKGTFVLGTDANDLFQQAKEFIANPTSDQTDATYERGSVVFVARRIEFPFAGGKQRIGALLMMDLSKIGLGTDFMQSLIIDAVAVIFAVIFVVAIVGLMAWRLLVHLGRGE